MHVKAKVDVKAKGVKVAPPDIFAYEVEGKYYSPQQEGILSTVTPPQLWGKRGMFLELCPVTMDYR